MAPLGKVARKQWTLNVLIFTAAGIVASLVVGELIATPGAHLSRDITASLAIASLGVLALLARELAWISFPLPNLQRQTDPRWRWRTFPVLAIAAWGFDIGSSVTTWATFSGAWAMLIIGGVLGEPQTAAALLAAFWCGRAATLLIGPGLLSAPTSTAELLEDLSTAAPVLRTIHVATLVCVFATLILWIGFTSRVLN